MEKELEQYFDRLWPICRSITGNGLRQSLEIIRELIPLELTEVPSGTKVFDWTVPREWNITDAYIITPSGKKIADFRVNNLHVVNYSIPVNKEITKKQLSSHIHTIPSQPDLVPYITSYYKELWGFCLSHNEWINLPEEGNYRVVIESELKNGSLTYGQLVLPGASGEEILFSTYVCHPSMANNELSGPLVTAFLYRKIAAMQNRRYTYRFVFAPETIGVIAFLAQHGSDLAKNIKAGYVMTCCGDDGIFHYKRSKHRTSLSDRAAEHVLKFTSGDHRILEFAVGGSDERQYCSPGFNFPVGSVMRTPYQKYPQYHTSGDDKSFVSFEVMTRTIEMCHRIVEVLEANEYYLNRIRYCEPQLGKYDLYPSSVNPEYKREEIHRLLHFLSFADGQHDLIEIAERKNSFALQYLPVIKTCRDNNLI